MTLTLARKRTRRHSPIKGQVMTALEAAAFQRNLFTLPFPFHLQLIPFGE